MKMFKIGLFITTVSMVLVAVGCDTGRIDVTLRQTDKLLAEQVVTLVETELSQLPAEHPIIDRYGDLVSITTGDIVRFRAYKHVAGGNNPPSLRITCHCVFANFWTPMYVHVTRGGARNVRFVLEPSQESLEETALKHPPGPRPVEQTGMGPGGDGLWFEFGEQGKGMSRRSSIDCFVSHPDFQP